MDKKKNLTIIGIVTAVVLLIGGAYAFFTYYRESDKVNQLIAGEVYLNFIDGENIISLTNVFPETVIEARERTDNVINFTINGVNTTTNKDIYYEIKLLYADNLNGKTRFNDEDLRFDLIETTNGVSETVLSAVSYNEINNKRIWVNTIEHDTTEELTRTYQLRMWLSDEVLISDSATNATYTTGEYKNSYANVKVAVYGDFVYKDIATPASCFAYNEVETVDYVFADYIPYELNTSEDGIAACKTFFMSSGEDMSDAQDGYQSFCEGTGTITFDGIPVNFHEFLASYDYNSNIVTILQDNNIIINVQDAETRYYTLNTDEEAVNACMNHMMNDALVLRLDGFVGTDMSAEQDGYKSFCEGTGTFKPNDTTSFSLQDMMTERVIVQSDVMAFVEKGVFNEGSTVIEITNYDVETCGRFVVIPSQINGYDVVRIADERSGTPVTQLSNSSSKTNPNTLQFSNYPDYQINTVKTDINSVFYNMNLIGVQFPETLQYIGTGAFSYNKITTLKIPKSVTTIMNNAFGDNPLIDVEIKGNPSLKDFSFYAESDQSDYVFETFKYGGTCEELNQYSDAFDEDFVPETIITSGGTCEYVNSGK